MVPTQPPPNTPPLDPQGFIAANTPCINCKYNLRALKPNGICPECGTQITQSVIGPLLRCVRLSSLSRLRSGLRLVLSGYICLTMTMLLGILLASLSYSGNPGILPRWGLLAGAVLQAVGIWKTTSFPPGNRKSASTVTKRIFLIISVCMVLSTVILLSVASSGSLKTSDAAVGGSISLFAFCFGAIGSSFCWRLKKTVGSYGLWSFAAAASWLAIPFVICGVLVGFGSLLVACGIGRHNADGGAEICFLWPGFLFAPVSLVGILIFLPLVLRYVSAELKIAKGWANPDVLCSRAQEGTSGGVVRP